MSTWPQEPISLDGLTWLPEPIHLDWSTWLPEQTSLDGLTRLSVLKFRWVNLAAAAEKSRQVD